MTVVSLYVITQSIDVVFCWVFISLSSLLFHVTDTKAKQILTKKKKLKLKMTYVSSVLTIRLKLLNSYDCMIVYWKCVYVRNSSTVFSCIFPLFLILEALNIDIAHGFSCICLLKCMNTFIYFSTIPLFFYCVYNTTDADLFKKTRSHYCHKYFTRSK